MTATEHVTENTVAILEKAYELLEPRGAWSKGDYARNGFGDSCAVTDPNVATRCAVGAIMAAADIVLGPGTYNNSTKFPTSDEIAAAEEILSDVIDSGIVAFNDAPGRTKRQVLSAFRKAKKRAKALA